MQVVNGSSRSVSEWSFATVLRPWSVEGIYLLGTLLAIKNSWMMFERRWEPLSSSSRRSILKCVVFQSRMTRVEHRNLLNAHFLIETEQKYIDAATASCVISQNTSFPKPNLHCRLIDPSRKEEVDQETDESIDRCALCAGRNSRKNITSKW